MTLKTFHIDCTCLTPEHSIRLAVWPEDCDIYLAMQLNPTYPWYKRVWPAIAYLLGRPVGWAETIVTSSDAKRMADFLDDASRGNV